MPWDFAAGIVLIREAGGVLRRPDGEVGLTPGPVYAANGPALMEELLEALARATAPAEALPVDPA